MYSFQIIKPDCSRPFTIGRKADNSLVLDNLLISRNHALIQYIERNHGKCWVLTNLTQNSVTQLNGVDVPFYANGAAGENVSASLNGIPDLKKASLKGSKNEKCGEPLNDGDVIHIGTYQLRVDLKDDELKLLLVNSPTSDSAELPNGVSATVEQSCALLSFAPKVISPQGRSIRSLLLKDGESMRLPGYEMSFSAGSLICKNLPQGFDVEVRHLNVYAGKSLLLKEMNFSLPAGEILAVIGRSGQGKTTFLKLLEGVNCGSESSDVRIGGLDYRNQELRKHVAFLAQEPQLRKDLTVKETLLDGGMTSMACEDFKKNVLGRLEKFCELFGLSTRMNHPVKMLSGGELRRVALAKELMASPGLIVLDEPLSGLDPYNAGILCNHLKQLAFLGHTVIFTTHNFESLKMANKLLVIHQGEQVFYGTPEKAYAQFGTPDAEKILFTLDSLDTHTRPTQTLTDLVPEISKPNLYFPKVYLSSLFIHKILLTAKQWIRDRGKALTILLQPLIIGFLFSQIFSSQTSLWIVAFAIILTANWLSLSLSIREVVSEKDILTGEFRKGVSVLGTVTAKMVLPTAIAWLQILFVFLFLNFRMVAHFTPLMLVVFFVMVFPPVVVGLMVSSFSKNSGQANALLPLLIIPQVALAGALVPLDQMLPVGRFISTVIWSRYSQNSLLNLLLEREDPAFNVLAALAIAVGCYIVMVLKLLRSKKAK